jgi:hypothetical protein
MIAISAAKNTAMIVTLDVVARARFGARTSGCSHGPDGLVIWLEDNATEIEIQAAQAMLAAHDSLILTQDKAQITANGTDKATVTIELADPEFDYTVWLNGIFNGIYAQGHDSVVGGVATLELTSTIVGVFTLEIRRRVFPYDSGYVTVEAV